MLTPGRWVRWLKPAVLTGLPHGPVQAGAIPSQLAMPHAAVRFFNRSCLMSGSYGIFMSWSRNLALGALCFASLVAGQVRAMEFNVRFDTYIGVSPTPRPPIVGTGYFGFDGNLMDGSYLFSSLTNVYMDYAFVPAPPDFPNPTYFYNYYGLPNPGPTDPDYNPAFPFPNSNFDYLYDPSLKVVIYNEGQQFYFDGPSILNYNVGALDLNIKQEYIDFYYPGQAPIYLSFQPNNTPIPPGGSAILPPYNRYGIYANTDINPATPPQLIVNGIYGTVVPGPLPILGVGAAFGVSRRLRRRVKATCSTAHQ
jgi:hypothetical protein